MKKEEKKKMKFVGSKGWLWCWIIIFWPIAVIYYFTTREYIKVE